MTERNSPAHGPADAASSRPRPRAPRWSVWLLRAALGLLGLIAAFLLALQHPAIGTRVTNGVLARIHVAPRSSLSAGDVRGDWLTHLELRGVRLTRGDTLLASIDTLRARYRLGSLLAGRLHIRELDLDGVLVREDIVDTTQTAPRPESSRPMTLADILRGRFYSGPSLYLDRLAVRNARYVGRLGSADSSLFTSVGVQARRLRLGRGFSFQLDSLDIHGPARGASGIEIAFSGGLDRGRFEARTIHFKSDSSAIDGNVILGLDDRDSLTEARLVLRGRPWSLRDLEMLMPGLGLEGNVVADIDVHGARPEQMSGTILATTDRARWGAFELGSVRLDATLADGRSDTKLSAVSGRAHAEVSGWVRPFDRTPTYDFQARTDRLPDRIPGTPWWESFAKRASAALALRVRGSGFARPVADVEAHARGASGRIDLDGGFDLTRRIAWSVRRLSFERVDVARLIGDTTASTLSGTLVASGDFDSTSRRMVTAIDLAPSSYGAWNIASGRARARVNGTEVGGSLRLETDAGSLELDSLAGRWDSVGVVRILEARFHDVDLERITGEPSLASRVGGRVTAEVRGLGSLAGPGEPTSALRDGRVSGSAQMVLEPSRFGQQEIESGSLALSLARGNVSAQGGLESSRGRLDLIARARPFDARATFSLDRARFTNVDLAAWTGTPALSSRLTGTAMGHGRSGVNGGSSDAWEATVHLDRSRMGQAEIDGGETQATWTGGQGHLVADLRSGGDTLSVRGEVALRDNVPEGHAELSIPFGLIASVSGRDSLKTSGGLVARTSFIGLAPATIALDGTLTGLGSFAEARLDSLFAGFHLRQGSITLDTLFARSNIGTATGAGRIALFDTTAATKSNLRLRLSIDDAKPLRRLFAADTVGVDTSTLDLRVVNTGGTRSFDVRGSLRALVWNDLRLLGADGSIRGDLDPSWRPVRAHLETTVRRLRGVGIPVNAANATIDYDGVKTDFDLTASQDERHRLHLVGRTLADSLGQHVALEKVDIQADSSTWALSNPTRIDYRPDRLEVQDFELRSARGKIQSHGVIDRRGDQSFRLEMQGVGLDVVSAWLGRENVTGTLSGSLALDGPAKSPRGNGGIQLDLTSDRQPAGALRSRLAWNGSRLDFGGAFTTPRSDSLSWAGSLPLAISLAETDSTTASRMRVLEGDVDVRVAAQHFPLAAFSPLLDPHTLGTMDGTLDIDTRLRGSSRAVVGSGRVDMNGGVVPLPGLGVVYRDIELHGEFVENRLVLRQARMTSQKGSLDAAGEFRFIGVTRVEPRVHVNSNHFVFVQTPDLRAIASGSVDLSGTLTSPVLKGKTTIENSSFTLTPIEATATEEGTTVQLTDADWRMLEENFGDVKAATPDITLRLYDASDLDLNIELTRNNWVRQRVQPKLSLALTGSFRLRKEPHGEPLLYGLIEPIPNRGFVEQFARSFDITGGEVLLNGPMKDHRVDINAQYKPPSSSESDESETTIQLDVKGNIDKLKLTLSSDPPMSEVEIINYIATGHSAADKSKPSSSEQTSLAKDIGLSQVTGFAEQAAQGAIGLDVLQVRFDALQGATLVAGRYLDTQLYVGFRQPLQYQQSGSPTSSETLRTSFEVEYAIHKWLVLNLQGETSKLRSFIRARHAY